VNSEETGLLFDEIISYYPAFESRAKDDPTGMIEKWQRILHDTPLDYAIKRLEQYASQSENRFAPHPGALAKVKTESDQYHDHMRQTGALTLETLEQWRVLAVAPTEEQRAKARRTLYAKPTS
jgi:hypothetical protein